MYSNGYIRQANDTLSHQGIATAKVLQMGAHPGS